MSTAIEWTDATWNPVTGCTRVSAGCDNCYASALHNQRYKANVRAALKVGTGDAKRDIDAARNADGPSLLPMPDTYDTPFAVVRTHPERLEAPLHWRKPRRIFTCSMGDLFHKSVPDAFIDQVFAVIALSPQHTFQVLTKQPERMREYMANAYFRVRQQADVGDVSDIYWATRTEAQRRDAMAHWWTRIPEERWPLPNVIGMTSVENQEAADLRVPILLDTPLAKRGLSCEPLLGPVDLHEIKVSQKELSEHVRIDKHNIDALVGERWKWYAGEDNPGFFSDVGARIDWVIVGGESGARARPCDIGWMRDIVRQCRAAGVPVFVKQLGQVVIDRNDAGFDGDTPTAWPSGTKTNVSASYQGAPLRVFLRHSHGGDPEEWPEDLRVREMPR